MYVLRKSFFCISKKRAKNGNDDQQAREEDETDTELISNVTSCTSSHNTHLPIYEKNREFPSRAILWKFFFCSEMENFARTSERRDVGEEREKRNSIFFAHFEKAAREEKEKLENVQNMSKEIRSTTELCSRTFERLIYSKINKKNAEMSHIYVKCRLSS